MIMTSNGLTVDMCEERYEKYVSKINGKEYVQYDYRDRFGRLFSTVKPTLELCRKLCSEWEKNK